MTAHREAASGGERLSKGELGQRVHSLQQTVVTGLLANPEFMIALGKRWAEPTANKFGEKNLRNIRFSTGGYDYVVNLTHAAPSPGMQWDGVIDLNVSKYEPGITIRQVANLHTHSSYKGSDENRIITDGSAYIEGEGEIVSFGGSPSEPSTSAAADAFTARAKEIFADLFAPVQL